MFYFKSVVIYKDEDLKRIAIKTLKNIIKKKNLRDLHEKLECNLRNLRR